jgi:hypothetical protein
MSGNRCGMRLQEWENGNGSGVTAIGKKVSDSQSMFQGLLTDHQLVPCS